MVQQNSEGKLYMAEADTRQVKSEEAGGWGVTTHWSVVLAAGKEAPESALALEKLCGAYWYPLYVYVRRKGHQPVEAQDLTQEFFARLLRNHFLAQADPRKGRFRCYLLAAMDHFLANEWHRAHAVKRGGARPLLSLDETAEGRYSIEPATETTPEKLYERRWAISLFERALKRLAEEHVKAGRSRTYERLREFLSAEPEPGDYEQAGKDLGMSRGAVAAAVYRLRQRYRELVRDEVAQTVASASEIEAEMRALLASLSG